MIASFVYLSPLFTCTSTPRIVLRFDETLNLDLFQALFALAGAIIVELHFPLPARMLLCISGAGAARDPEPSRCNSAIRRSV